MTLLQYLYINNLWAAGTFKVTFQLFPTGSHGVHLPLTQDYSNLIEVAINSFLYPKQYCTVHSKHICITASFFSCLKIWERR